MNLVFFNFIWCAGSRVPASIGKNEDRDLQPGMTRGKPVPGTAGSIPAGILTG